MSDRGLVLGTAGHVDHGKTTLVRALTGVDTDRWREEKERGLTIDLGFASLPLDNGAEVGVVDVPGHEDFLRNMLAGSTGLDLVLLVVAADEGPMPQTREHLSIARLLGVRRGLVALTKVDRVDAEWRELARETVREELTRVLGPETAWPIVPVSAVSGEGLDALRARIAAAAASCEARPSDDLFRLPVDRAFTVHGTGTVVTGTVWSGVVAVGDELRLLPDGPTARVRALQVHGASRERVGAGRRCAAALVGVAPEEAPRGTSAVGSGAWRPARRVGARLRLLPEAGRPLEHDQRVRVFHGTRETMARVRLPGRAPLPPGGEGWAALRLERPLVVRVRDRFILRFYSPVTTIGGGEIAELEPPGRWEGGADGWVAVLDGGPAEAFAAAVRRAGRAGLARDALPLATGVPLGRLRALTDAPPEGLRAAGDRWFAAGALRDAEAFLTERLGRMHRSRRRAPAVARSALRAAAGERFALPLVDLALDRLAERGEVVAEGPSVRLPEHRARLTAEERRASERLVRTLERAGLEPPDLEALARGVGGSRELLHDLLRRLEAEGAVVPISPDLWVSRATAERIVTTARSVLDRGAPAPASAFKTAFGVSRKYLIPILEYLDRTGVTRRVGEGRVPAR